MSKLYLLLLLLLPLSSYAQVPPIYSKVQFSIDQDLNIQTLAELGIAIDHVHKNGPNTVDLVLDENEIALLESASIEFQILIPDLAANYEQLWQASKNNLVFADCGVTHFDEGSMGSYHSYDDMIVHINLMQEEFPELVKVMEVGKSVEDRTVYAVKISDQVEIDESADEGVVYYDALTHAREPMGLETHLYYMWWLLENYGTDPEATYLLDHRELYFIPVVNPDGYVYNQTTNPNGGGFWRKNRRDNGGGCFGIDLNRNYDNEWGNLAGASSDPCNNRYHGTAAFSEPETQNVRDFVDQIQPGIAFSCHTYSDVFLCPNSFDNDLVNYEVYADYTSEFIPREYGGYGTWAMMIGYFGTGTTQDYLNEQGTIAWTPEIGHNFWENPAVICDRVQEMFGPMKYLTWVSGDFITLQDYYLTNESQLWNGDEMELVISLRNKGLRGSNAPIQVMASSSSTGLEALETSFTLSDFAPQERKDNSSNPIRFKLQDGAYETGDEIIIDLKITQQEVLIAEKKLIFYAGARSELFSEDCENGPSQWQSTGAATWDSTFMDAHGGHHSMADSRYGNYPRNATSIFTNTTAIDLSNSSHPFVEFKAKWSLEQLSDFVVLEISDDQINWEPLEGKYSSMVGNDGIPAYTYNQHWISEHIDLSAYKDFASAYFRFRLSSDFGVESDGFYFDEFKIVDYFDGMNVGLNDRDIFSEINLFPNPNQGQSELHFSLAAGQEVTWQILDVAGKMIQEGRQKYSAGEHRQVLNFPERGIYLVKIKTGTSIKTFKTLSL